MDRLNKDEYYLNIAKEVSRRSTCLKRQYGAVIVKNREIISTGYNGSPRGIKNCCDINFCPRLDAPHNSGDYGNCQSVHAEQNAIISAARKDMIDSDLYLFGREGEVDIYNILPCPVCMKIIINAGIKNIITANQSYSVEDIIDYMNSKNG